MKKTPFILSIVFVCSVACTKSSSGPGLAALNIIQAASNVPGIVVNFSDTAVPYYQDQVSIGQNASLEYGLPAGNNIPYWIISSGDTTRPLVKGSFSLKAGLVYSFYLSGLGSQVDTLLLQDILPLHKDSTAGVRFINLSPDSHPIAVTLAGDKPGETEFSDLGYKQISSFKSYPGTGGISSYNFVVRDQATGDSLTSFSWNFILYRNYTLVINGAENPAARTLSVFQVNNF